MGKERFCFVGVSPKPYYGCDYYYLDESGTVQPKTYVWVKMGRHDTEQIVYVDTVIWRDKETAPYPVEKIKKVLRKATEQEIATVKSDWSDTILL